MSRKNQPKTQPNREKFFFIVGRGRSGTWLLQSILDHHPQICVAPEAEFILNLFRKYQDVERWSDKRNQSFLEDLWRIKRISEWLKPDKEKLREELFDQPEDTTFQDKCLVVYRNYARSIGKQNLKILGDKYPVYSLFLDRLSKIMPQAKFVHMVRDPRDTVISFKNVNFDLNETAALAHRWNLFNTEINSFKKKYPQKFVTIRYEDLLHNTRKELRRITNLLGISYDPSMLNFYRKPRNLLGWNKNIASPIKNQKAFGWNHKMDKRRLKIIDSICARLCERFGYKVGKVNLSFWMHLRILFGKLYGGVITQLERKCYDLPFNLQILLVHLYRGQKPFKMDVHESKKESPE